MTSQTIVLVTYVNMNNVEQREPTVNATVADPVCATVSKFRFKFHRFEAVFRIMLSDDQSPCYALRPSFGNITA
jgi:hypothetical protein